METFFHLFKYPLVSGLWSQWDSSNREVLLPHPSAVLSCFLLFLLSRDAWNCCSVKILIAAAGAGVDSWTHQRPKDLLPLGLVQCLWLQSGLNDLLISWHRLPAETGGCPSPYPPELCTSASCPGAPTQVIAKPGTDCILGETCCGTEVGFRAWMQRGLNKQPSQRPQKLWVHPLPDLPEETGRPCWVIPAACWRPLSSGQIVLNEEAGTGRPACDSDFGMAPRPSLCVLNPGEHATPEQGAPGVL